MDYTNDFIGSFADENVKFTTQVIKTASVGDNYWTVLIFAKAGEYADVTDTALWAKVPGVDNALATSVDADSFAAITSGLLQSWLTDLFINGFQGNCILCALPSVDTGTVLEQAYEALKAYAYWKTICIGNTDDTITENIPVVDAALAVQLCKLCYADSEFLSAAPCLPVIEKSPASDVLFTKVKAETQADAFFTYHADKTRNGSLYALGLALSVYNGSGTVVGNTLDMTKSGNITASGEDGTVPTAAVKNAMDAEKIGYYKPVGDNSGMVASEGGSTLRGRIIAAYWIKAYVTYMCKVRIAQLITQMNFRKNSTNYNKIVDRVQGQLGLFSEGTGGQLINVIISAPAFDNLPSSSDHLITVPNAWSATYVDNIHEVRITGTMYIGA